MTTRWNPNTEQTITHCQFSWVCQKKHPPSSSNPKYIQAEQIAEQVINENKWKDEISNNVLFFHSTQINPRWAYVREFIIGNHVFYSANVTK
jgi:spore germination cell wall hydrolase CwlJ-like protein